MPQPLGAGEVGLDGGFGLLYGGQAALDFGDDAVLLGEGWEGYGKLLTLPDIQIWLYQTS